MRDKDVSEYWLLDGERPVTPGYSSAPSPASAAVREAGRPLHRELCAALTREQLQGSMS